MAPCRMSESLVQIAVHAQEPFCGLMTAAHFAEVGLEEGFKKARQHELTVIDITSTTTRLIPRSNRNRVTARCRTEQGGDIPVSERQEGC